MHNKCLSKTNKFTFVNFYLLKTWLLKKSVNSENMLQIGFSLIQRWLISSSESFRKNLGTQNKQMFSKSSKGGIKANFLQVTILFYLSLRQGLGYSGYSAAKVLTKFYTQNTSPKNSGLRPKNFSPFQPCMTL